MSRGAQRWLVVAAAVGLVAAPLFAIAMLARADTRVFRIPTESMVPTLRVGDRVTVNEDAYDDAEPRIGDIVIIHPPEGAIDGRCGVRVPSNRLCPRPQGGPHEVFFVERIVAGPGDRLRVVDGRAIVDGRRLREPWVRDCLAPQCTFRGTITIPDGHWFLMGDNRGASDDSRFWGPVPRDQIVGRVDECWPLGLKCEKTRDPG